MTPHERVEQAAIEVARTYAAANGYDDRATGLVLAGMAIASVTSEKACSLFIEGYLSAFPAAFDVIDRWAGVLADAVDQADKRDTLDQLFDLGIGFAGADPDRLPELLLGEAKVIDQALADAEAGTATPESLEVARKTLAALPAKFRAMTDRTSTPPAPGLREALADIFAHHEGLGCCDAKTLEHVWQSIEPLAALRAESVAAPAWRANILSTPEEQGLTPGGDRPSFDEEWDDLLREFPTRRDATVRGILDKHRPSLAAALHAPPALDGARLRAKLLQMANVAAEKRPMTDVARGYERACDELLEWLRAATPASGEPAAPRSEEPR